MRGLNQRIQCRIVAAAAAAGAAAAGSRLLLAETQRRAGVVQIDGVVTRTSQRIARNACGPVVDVLVEIVVLAGGDAVSAAGVRIEIES